MTETQEDIQLLARAEAAELESLLTEFHAAAKNFVQVSYNGHPGQEIVSDFWRANAKVEMRLKK